MKIKIPSYGENQDRALRVWMELFKSFRKIHAKEAKFIDTFGITMNQFVVLEVLFHRGDLTVGEITKLTMSTPGNITVVVKNLKKLGLIEAIASSTDARAKVLSITEEGKKIISGIFQEHANRLSDCFESLEEEEIESLGKILRKLQKSQ